jgi:hypothetical protein
MQFADSDTSSSPLCIALTESGTFWLALVVAVCFTASATRSEPFRMASIVRLESLPKSVTALVILCEFFSMEAVTLSVSRLMSLTLGNPLQSKLKTALHCSGTLELKTLIPLILFCMINPP